MSWRVFLGPALAFEFLVKRQRLDVHASPGIPQGEPAGFLGVWSSGVAGNRMIRRACLRDLWVCGRQG